MQLLCESLDILNGLNGGEKVKGKQLLEESVIEGKGKSRGFVTIQAPQQCSAMSNSFESHTQNGYQK